MTCFTAATIDETLVAAMFNVAATRYFNATFDDGFDESTREAIAFRIASQVKAEHVIRLKFLSL